MDAELITIISKDRIISDLCLQWYLETDDDQKKIIFEEIQATHKILHQEKK